MSYPFSTGHPATSLPLRPIPHMQPERSSQEASVHATPHLIQWLHATFRLEVNCFACLWRPIWIWPVPAIPGSSLLPTLHDGPHTSASGSRRHETSSLGGTWGLQPVCRLIPTHPSRPISTTTSPQGYCSRPLCAPTAPCSNSSHMVVLESMGIQVQVWESQVREGGTISDPPRVPAARPHQAQGRAWTLS